MPVDPLILARNGDPIIVGGIYSFLNWKDTNVRVLGITTGPCPLGNCCEDDPYYENSSAFLLIEKTEDKSASPWVYHIADFNNIVTAFNSLIRKEFRKPHWTRILLGRE